MPSYMEQYRAGLTRSEQEAAQADSDWLFKRRMVLRDSNLSQQGKQNKLEPLGGERVSRVSAAQESAFAVQALAEKQHTKAKQEELRKEEEAERALLGDATLLQLLDGQYRRSTAQEIMRDVRESVTDWRRAVAMRLAASIIDERAAGGKTKYVRGEQDADLAVADAELRGIFYDARAPRLAELDQEARELAAGKQRIEAMDLDAQRRYMERFGISYEASLAQADEQDRQARGV